MKKAFLLMMASVLVFGACSQSETLAEKDGESISFRPTLFNATKAADANVATTANLTEFHVYGRLENGASLTNFMSSDVSYSGSAWTYSPLKYWPETSGSKVLFFGVSPKGTSNASISTTAGQGPAITGFAPAATTTDQKDLIVAAARGDKTNNSASGVQLAFQHALSQIVVNANIGTDSPLKIKVKGVKLCRLLGSADLNMYANNFGGTNIYPEASTFTSIASQTEADASYNTWVWKNYASSANSDYTSLYTTAVGDLTTTAASIQGDYNFMVLPQEIVASDAATVNAWQVKSWNKGGAGVSTVDNNGIYMAVQLSIANETEQLYPSAADTYAFTAIPIPAIKWEPGKKYVYTLTFDPEHNGSAGWYEPTDGTNGGKPILNMSPIVFTNITVDAWTEISTSIDTK